MKPTPPLLPKKTRVAHCKDGPDSGSRHPFSPYLCHADTRAYSLCSGPPGRAIRSGFMW